MRTEKGGKVMRQRIRPMNPYIAGSLAGVLSVVSTWLTGKYFGASTSFVRSTGFVEKVFASEHFLKVAYLVKYAPKIDWQLMFIVGIFLGALMSSFISGTFRIQLTPDSWEDRFGVRIFPRAVTAFIGGVIAMFGARLADG
jgi:hypothetical protein